MRLRLEIVGEGLLDVQDPAVRPRVLDEQPVEHPDHVRGFGDRAVEVGAQPRHAVLGGDLPDRDEAAVVPARIVAAQLHLQALQPVAPDPVREQHRVAVVRLVALEFRGDDRVLARDQVPGGDALRCGVDQVLGRVSPRERDPARPFGNEVVREVAVHVLRRVGLVDGEAEQHAEGVVEREVERRAAHQGGEPGHRLARPAQPVVLPQQRGEDTVDEPVADLDRVPAPPVPEPRGGDPQRELLQGAMTLLVGQRAGPHPLDAERGFTPAARGPATPILDVEADPEAGDRGQGFRPELERDAGREGQEPRGAPLHLDVVLTLPCRG